MLYFFVIFNIKNFYKYETEIEFLLIVKLTLQQQLELRKYKMFKSEVVIIDYSYR